MAKIQFGAIVVGARGKLNGSQFSVNKSGAVLQNKANQRRAKTPAQTQVNARFGYLARYWRTLSPSQQADNNSATPFYPYVDKFGNTRYFTGYQLLLRSNLNRAYSGLGPISVVPTPPPAGFDLVDPDLIVAVSGSGVTELVVSWVGGSPNPENYSVQVFASGPQSSGLEAYSGAYYALGYQDANIGEYAINPVPGKAGLNWYVGGQIFTRVVVIHKASGIEVSHYLLRSLIFLV